MPAESGSAKAARQPALSRPRRASRGNQFAIEPTIRKPAEQRGPRADRTIARIEEATREIFQSQGYAGTTIERITDAAGVSRASFYTYFPSKRDVLISLGADTIRATVAVIKRFEALPTKPRISELRRWLDDYFELLDVHGSFAFAWTQAALHDPEIRQAGIVGHLRLCRRIGDAMGTARGEPFDRPVEQGLLLVSLLERSWSYAQLYRGVLDATVLLDDLANGLAVQLRCRRP
jgi:AcrR family transcriptional regulator